MPNQFQQGYRNLLWQAKGFPSGQPEGISFDPTLMYAANERPPTAEQHLSSGTFYRFNVSPTSFDLDPYFFFNKNDFKIAIKSGNSTDHNLTKNPPQSGSHSVQIMATRGPIYLSGWGYDICGLPVPCSGTNARIFNPTTPVERRLWKTGPVDLRWDDDRKVWTGGPEIIEGVMRTALPAGSIDGPSVGSGLIHRGRNLQYTTFNITGNNNPAAESKPDPYGIPVGSPYQKTNVPELVAITNRTSIVLQSGDYFTAVKLNYEWRLLTGGGGNSCIVGKFKKLECSNPNIAKTTIPPFTVRKIGTGNTASYKLKFENVGTKKIYYFKTNFEYLPSLIPSDSAGGSVVDANGYVDITNTINGNNVPYSGYFSVVAFNNCEWSSNVYTYQFPPTGDYSAVGTTQPDGTTATGNYRLMNTNVLNRLFDCPQSNDNFGLVTDDQTGREFYAMHPFKFIKHNVRVVACPSNISVVCQGVQRTAYVISEVDDYANAGTSYSRE